MARRRTERIQFGKRRLEALMPPERGRRCVHDTKVPGLCLYVTAKGAKSFYWYRSVNGRPERCCIGAFPAVTVEQARRRAAKMNADVAEGRNPAAARRARRAESTLREVFEQYLEQHARPQKKTVQYDVETFERHLAHLANRRVSSITRNDVEKLKRRIGGTRENPDRPYMANRVLALLSAIYNKAAPDAPNPVRGVDRFPEESRDRHMTKDEIRRLFAALAEEDSFWADFFSLAIFTGARRGNLFSMRWDDVDLAIRRWRVPGRESKSGRPMPIPLSEPAVEILRRRAAQNGEFEWVFPSETSRSGHIEDARRPWRRVLKRAGLSNLRIHDLRRSLASVMVAEGVPLLTIAKTLGHRDLKATAVYARLDFGPQLEAVERAGATIRGILAAAGTDAAKGVAEGAARRADDE